jgi:hypothetical protein
MPRSFVSTDSDLVPMRDWLRANVGGGARLHSSDPLGAPSPLVGTLFWAFGGSTEEFDPTVPVAERHSSPHRTLSAPVNFATLEGLNSDIAGLESDPVLGALFAAPGPAPTGCGGGGGGGGGTSSDAYITRANLTMDPASTEVFWTVPPRPCPPTPPPPTALPVLTIQSTFGADVNVSGTAENFFDIQVHHVAIAVSITPTICGTSLAHPCQTSGQHLFDDYLRVLPEDAVATSEDAAYPDAHVELAVSAGYVETPDDVFVAVDAGCPTIAAFLGTILGAFIGQFAGPYGAAIGAAIGAVVGGLSAGITCGVLAVTEVTPAIRAGLASAVAPTGRLADVMVNPPRFRVTLHQALLAAADGLVDRDGDGVADVDATGATVRARNGRVELAEVNLLLAPVTIDGVSFFGLAASWDDIPVSLEAEAALAPDAPDGFTPISSPEGAFLDAAVVAFAGRSDGSPTPIRVTRASVEFGAVSPACAPGVTSPPALCMGCGSAIGCPGPGCPCPGASCPVFCTADGTSLVPSLPVASARPLLELDLPPSPRIATLLSAAPMTATAVRRILARPLPRGSYYTAATGATGSATFTYRVDPDHDLVDSHAGDNDNCPDLFNPDQADDGDGDRFGAACDHCQGVATFADADNADGDGDGAGYACDCDVDADLCPNAGVEIVGGVVVPCAPSAAGVFDANPDFAGADRNGDGVSDDCDPDVDGDGVPNAMDNCPFGDGDLDLTEAVDRNPSQTDSGGSHDGDLCDALCQAPGAEGCTLADLAHYAPIDTGFDLRGFLPIAPTCLFDGPGCGLLALGACSPKDPGCVGGIDQLILVGSRGEQLTAFDAASLGVDFRFSPIVIGLEDLDGDARADFAIGAPHAMACPSGALVASASKSQCAGDAGVVLIVGSATQTVLARLGTGESAAQFGAALAFSDGVLAVGAPGATNAAGLRSGAAFLYRLGPGAESEALLPTFGRGAGDQFGAHVVAFPVDADHEPQFIVGAPFAETASLDAGQLTRIDGALGAQLTYDGARASGGLSRAVVVAGASGTPVVVGAAPGSKGATGALYFFDGRTGRRRSLVVGAAGDGLGTSLVAVADAAGVGAVLAGAPGRRAGAGALDRYTADARRTSTTLFPGTALGTWVAAPGDLDGDGARDVIAGVQRSDGALVVVEILALSTTR